MKKLKYLRSFENYEHGNYEIDRDLEQKHKKQIEDWNNKASAEKETRVSREKAAKERQEEIDYIRKFNQ